MLTHRVGTVAIRQIPRCLMSCAEFSLGLQFSLHHFDHSIRVFTHNWKSSPHVTNSSTLLLVAKYDVPSVQFMRGTITGHIPCRQRHLCRFSG